MIKIKSICLNKIIYNDGLKTLMPAFYIRFNILHISLFFSMIKSLKETKDNDFLY